MRSWFVSMAAVLLLVAAAPKSPWPDTPAGAMARQWVDAFRSEEAMRAFYAKNIDEGALRKRGIEDRIVTYRASKEMHGALKFTALVSSKPDVLEVMLTDSDGQSFKYTFTVNAAPPHKLISIMREEKETHGHGGLLDWLFETIHGQ